VTQLGLFARIVADVPYWNWYGFPLDYTISTMYDDVIGFFCTGMEAKAGFRFGTRSKGLGEESESRKRFFGRGDKALLPQNDHITKTLARLTRA
jgi:hypothetical protein